MFRNERRYCINLRRNFMIKKRKTVILLVVLSCFLIGGMTAIAKAESAMKIGYVDLQKIFQEYGKTKEFDEKLTSMSDQAQRTLKEGSKSLEELQNQYQNQEQLLSESAKQRRLKEIEDKITELNNLANSTQENLQRQQELYTKEILEDIFSVIDEIAEKEGWRIILDKGTLLYPRAETIIPDDEFDLTEKVIERLNEKYKAENGK